MDVGLRIVGAAAALRTAREGDGPTRRRSAGVCGFAVRNEITDRAPRCSNLVGPFFGCRDVSLFAVLALAAVLLASCGGSGASSGTAAVAPSPPQSVRRASPGPSSTSRRIQQSRT
jgi:hypothetical protein